MIFFFRPFSRKSDARAGMGLVEAIVAMGIGLIVLLSLTSLILSFHKDTKALEQKLDVLNLQQLMQTALTGADVCNCHLNPQLNYDDSQDGVLRFNTAIVDGSQRIPLPRIRLGCSAASPILVEEGMTLPSGVVVDKVYFRPMAPTGLSEQWHGEWQVSFREDSLVRSFKTIQLRQLFTHNVGLPGTVLSCGPAVATGGGSGCASNLTGNANIKLLFPSPNKCRKGRSTGPYQTTVTNITVPSSGNALYYVTGNIRVRKQPDCGPVYCPVEFECKNGVIEAVGNSHCSWDIPPASDLDGTYVKSLPTVMRDSGSSLNGWFNMKLYEDSD